MGEDIRLEGLVIKETAGRIDLSQSPDRIFTSLHSRHLASYKDGVIRSEDFDTDESLKGMTPEYVKNYRRFLGFRHVHLGTLAEAGFFNPNYDLTFDFSVVGVLSKPALVCDHDALAKLLMYGSVMNVQEVFKEKERYEMGDEVLVRSLDLRSSKRVLVYSKDAMNALEACQFASGIEKVDLSGFRPRAVELYFK
jgi:hypothetical protein